MLIRLLYHETKIPMPTLFFDKNQQKTRPLSRFFFLNFPRYRPFLAYFLQKKNSHVFFLKYPTTETSDFQKVENKNLVSFWTPFFAVFGTFLPDIIGVFWPKKTQDICNDILFFLWYPFFFVKKCFRGDYRPKKKDITFKVKDITKS